MFGVGDASSVGKDIFEILFGFCDGESFDGFGSFVCVFIMNSEIFSGGLSD